MGPLQAHAPAAAARAPLLERTFLTVKEVIGARVGYNDSGLLREFRREHGVSPSSAARARRWPISDEPGLIGGISNLPAEAPTAAA